MNRSRRQFAQAESRPWPADARTWCLFLGGLVAAYFVFESSARWLSSDRGQWGAVVAALVVGTILLVQAVGLGERWRVGLRMFRPPALRSLLVAALCCSLLLTVVPVYASVKQLEVQAYPGWVTLLAGIFLQAGVAEEALFRGYLFGHLRQGRGFWRAALIASVPFTIVHLGLFATLPLPVAISSLGLALLLSFPLARLYEIGGGSIWAPAILHCVIQAVPKLIVVEEPGFGFPIAWMAACAVLPYAVFLFRLRPLASRQ